jgi:hypothetical protein
MGRYFRKRLNCFTEFSVTDLVILETSNKSLLKGAFIGETLCSIDQNFKRMIRASKAAIAITPCSIMTINLSPEFGAIA